MSDEAPTPEPAETPETEPQQSDSAELGDAGKKALEAERARANDATKALKALQAQHDAAAAKATALEQAQQESAKVLAERELALTRLNVAYDKGLPKELLGRLQGTDEAALQADADELMKLLGAQSHAPRPDPSQGAKTPASLTPEAQFVSVMGDLFKH